MTNAETVQSDIRRTDAQGRPQPINLFFSPEKSWSVPYPRWSSKFSRFEINRTRLRISVFTYATGILAGTSLGLLAAVYGILRRQLRTRGT